MSSNTIKIIAGVSMFLDHLGFILFPSELWLRIVGRLAFPIFAFCIAEGATYTKNYLKYICLVGITALVCDIAVFVVQGRYMSCAVTTFFFSLVLIYLYKKVESAYKKNITEFTLYLIALTVLIGIIYTVSRYVFIEYGIVGVLTALIIYALKNRYLKVIAVAVLSLLLSLRLGQIYCPQSVQWVSVFSCIIIFLYNGKRGKYNMKYFFYLFYPIHIAILYGINMIIK